MIKKNCNGKTSVNYIKRKAWAMQVCHASNYKIYDEHDCIR